MSLAKLKNSGILRPLGLCDRDGGVKAGDKEFKNAPQEVVSIPRCIQHSGDCCQYFNV
jgi:hypothetical protein